jgi:transposase
LEFPHGDRALKLDAAQRRVRIPGIGTVPLRRGRAIAAFGRAFVVERNRRWWAIFESDRDPVALPSTGRVVGIDRGVHVLAATSDAELLRNGKHGERLQRVVCGRTRYRQSRGRPGNAAEGRGEKEAVLTCMDIYSKHFFLLLRRRFHREVLLAASAFGSTG